MNGLKKNLKKILQTLPAFFFYGMTLFYRKKNNEKEIDFEGPVLVILTDKIGDTITALPALQQLKNQIKGRVDCLSRASTESILKNYSVCDDVFTINKLKFLPGWKSLKENIDIIRRLRKRKYKTVFDMSFNFYTAWISFWVGATNRYGCSRAMKVGFMMIADYKFLYTNHCQSIPQSDYLTEHVNLLKAIGVKIETYPKHSFMEVKEHAIKRMVLYVKKTYSTQKVVIINPFATQQIRLWPFEKYAELLSLLSAHAEIHLMIASGTPEEKNLAGNLLKQCARPVQLLDVNLDQYIALVKMADLVIANDSASLHIGYAVGTNVLGIFGPTDPQYVAPLSEFMFIAWNKMPCSPCTQLGIYDRCPLGHHQCMNDLPAERVYSLAKKILGLHEGLEKKSE